MTRDEAIRHACRTVSLVREATKDFEVTSDGFCCLCSETVSPAFFQHDGQTLRYVRRAVLERLKADNFELPEGVDPWDDDSLGQAAATEKG